LYLRNWKKKELPKKPTCFLTKTGEQAREVKEEPWLVHILEELADK
jgi:hypothetical protein